MASMGLPSGIGIVDTMIGFPVRDKRRAYEFITRQTHDGWPRFLRENARRVLGLDGSDS